MRGKDIRKQYETAATADFPDDARLLLICVNKTIEKPNLPLLDAVRYSWVLSPDRAAKAEYVFAVAHGLILGVYVVELPWKFANKSNFPNISEDHGNWKNQKGRYGFHGHEAPRNVWDRYCGKRVPDEWRSHGVPIRYVHF
jgi:hypothetical protein